MKQPNFLCVGAAKSGTTTLAEILRQNPNIYLPEYKEVHFFDNNEHYKNGLKWYYKEFEKASKKHKLIGEMTPSYLYMDYVPQRIAESLPDIKIIIILRNPVDRAYSQFKMNLRREFENQTFLNALDDESIRINKDYKNKILYSYIDRGYYSKQITNYLKYFNKDQIFICLFEDFMKNQVETLKNIESFLDVESFQYDLSIHKNKESKSRVKWFRKYIQNNNKLRNILKKIVPSYRLRRKMSSSLNLLNQTDFKYKKLDQKIKENLYNTYYKDEIEELEKVIGKNLNKWKF